MEWKDRVKSNPYLKKLIIDGEEKIVEIREVDENIIENGTPLNAENMQGLDDRVTNLEIYSTIEKAIGKWKDNKTIYRKVFEFTNLGSIFTDTIIVQLIKMDCMIHSANGQWRTLPWLYSNKDVIDAGTWSGGFYYRDDNQTINFQVGSNLENIDKGIIILEYTKE